MKKLKSILLSICVLGTVCSFTSCGKPNLEGKWNLCNSNGEELNFTVKFNDSGKMTIKEDEEDESEKVEYEVIDKDTIEIDDEDYDFKIIDKDEKNIYLGEFSDNKEKEILNSAARFLSMATDCVLTEIEDNDMYYEDTAIICSDKSKNINPIPENAKSDFDFSEYIEPFFSDIDDYEYIVIIENNKCTKAVCTKDKKVLGTYPEGKFEDMTFDEIYDELKKKV